MWRAFIQEAGLGLASVILGALVLISIWCSRHLDQSIVGEFQNEVVSIVAEPASEDALRTLLETSSEVLRFDIYEAKDNKQAIERLYPELDHVLKPLNEEFFPIAATIVASDASGLLKKLSAVPNVLQKEIIHRPPEALRVLTRSTSFILLGLWIVSLLVILHFQLERLSFREIHRWSLMKMLGARSSRVIWPYALQQGARLIGTALLSTLLASLFISQLTKATDWNWPALGLIEISAFIVGTVFLGMASFYGLFGWRYRETALG